MAVLLALGAALAYGLSDFIGGLVSRRTSAWSVAVVGGAASAVCHGAARAVLSPASPRPADFVWALLAGVGSGVGVGFLYRGLRVGADGRRRARLRRGRGAGAGARRRGHAASDPAVLVWLGIVARRCPRIWLVSPRAADRPSTTATAVAPPGLLDGVLAGLGFGLLFAASGRCPGVGLGAARVHPAGLGAGRGPAGDGAARRLGAARPRGGLGGPHRTLRRLGHLLFLLATQHGYLTVAGVLTSLYPATTVLLAAVVLREQIHRAQALGLALCAVTVTLVAAG